MPASSGCPECGASLPHESPRGLCPRCLMGAASSATASYHPPGKPPGPGASHAGPPVDFAEFRRAAVELGLVEPGELDRLAAAAAGDVMQLGIALIRAGRLTSYQAKALAQGKARGLLIGDYLVMEKRGRGGMGVVFRAKDRASGRFVALKILLPSFGRDREAVLRFRREFQVAAGLEHPNVVAALEAAEDRGVQFLTMEYVEGHDLDHLVREAGPLPIELAIHCTIQAARGLAAAHALGIIHRDVKPSNLMLDATGLIRVLDLGLARVIEATSPLGRDAAGSLTESGAYLGTVDFIAPEQANDAKKADHHADIYSLGCTLHFLLAGRPPFGGATVLQRLMAHQQQPAPSLLAARADVPAALEAAYQAMMAKRPDDRTRSMAEVIGMLEACRSSPEEATEARAGLKSFARTVKRRPASARRDPETDASIFANRPDAGGVKENPDLSLEDLVMDFRKETPAGVLAKADLPPKPPRVVLPPEAPRRPPNRLIPGAIVASVIGLAAFLLYPRAEPRPRVAAPTSAVAVGAEVAPQAARAGPRPLFNGENLAGWSPYASAAADWRVEDGALVVRGRDVWYMGLFTEQKFTDFRLRLEFQAPKGSDSGLWLGVFEPPGKLKHLEEFNLCAADEPGGRTGDFMAGDSGGEWTHAKPRSATMDARDGWHAMELSLVDGLATVKVDGRPVEYAGELGRIEGPRQIGLQGDKGTVRFRKIEIEELTSTGTPPPPKPATIARPSTPVVTPPRVLFVDEFNDPKANTPHLTTPDPKKEPVGLGFEPGLCYIQERAPGNWGWNWRGDLVDFSFEAVGRVVRGMAKSRGSWGVLLLARERGFQIRIDGDGALWVEPSFWTAEKYPNDPRIGPIVNAAIRPGHEYNTLRLNVRRRRLEVLVNNVLVCEPIALDWDLTPALAELGLWVDAAKVRAEFDRIEFKELPPDNAAPARDPVGTWLHHKAWRLDLHRGGEFRATPGTFTGHWSRSGTIITLHGTHADGKTFQDRVELDEDGSHYSGANREGLKIFGCRVPAASAYNAIGMALAPIPAGEFAMGTSAAQVDSFQRQYPDARRDLFADEQPEHRVRITRPFYLGVTEVTVGQFRAFVEAEGYKTDAERDGKGALGVNDRGETVEVPGLIWRAPGFPQADSHPVVNVSWNDAAAFCAWLGRKEVKAYRLPTEAEWEYASRAGSRTRYASGDHADALTTLGNVADESARDKYAMWLAFPGRDTFVQTAPVAEFRPNAFGLYDTTGNAWEWCADLYEATYYGQGVADDPKGATDGPWRVLRGGGWNFDAPSCRPADRAAAAPERRSSAVGFRIARDLAPGERFGGQ